MSSAYSHVFVMKMRSGTYLENSFVKVSTNLLATLHALNETANIDLYIDLLEVCGGVREIVFLPSVQFC